ncbi:tetratricopeptide repeat protein [Bradyrhizobium sp. R2.2-H]|nr:tetratricopeptide repeat protein [Bradyrhizobium sp. Y-H1]TCU76149.1 tetratricopeptide repeat protein [Bradyrhizobium sp. R2.2-H]
MPLTVLFMTDHTSVSISPPADWQAFERNARLLFQLSLNDPAVQNNGTSGQRQHGVDIFGRRGGGAGPLVGVQCKGKNGDYGKKVTEKELRDEVEKTGKFVPSLDEFILITTVQTDATIQKAARLLEVELRAKGRALSIQVWGWDRVQQEINLFPQAIEIFHPDATPFTGKILDANRETQRLIQQTGDATLGRIAGLEAQIASITALLPSIASDKSSSNDALDAEFDSQIDGYRDDLIRADKPRTALGLLMRMKERVWATASTRIRYRIVANIGAAHFNLGEYEDAADWLLQAAEIDPSDPGGISNKIAALLIKGRKIEAHAAAVVAIAAHPDHPEIGQQRLQALAQNEDVEAVWNTLPEQAKSSPQAHAIRVALLREAQDGRWPNAVAEAVKAFPNDEGIKILHAEAVVQSFQNVDPGGVGVRSAVTPSQAELTAAAETLEAAYRTSTGKETPAKAVCAHNAALAWSLLGEVKRAAELLDAAIASGLDGNESRHNRIMLYRRNGQRDKARELAEKLDDSPMSKIIRADLYAEVDPGAAREILADRATFGRINDIVPAALVVIETFVKQGRYEDAKDEALRLKAALPAHPQGPLALFRVRRAQGDADAETALDEALALVDSNTDFPTRFIIAEALASAQRFDDIAELLNEVTSRQIDSPALRALLGAAINSDRRVLAREILDQVPAAVGQQAFYRKSRIALESRSGNIPVAEKLIRAFLASDPTDLELHLLLLAALFRQNNLKELRIETAKPWSAFKGEPEDFMKLAQFMDDFADWREAHKLGYKTLLDNPNSQTVAMGYVGLFLRPGHSRGMEIVPAKVGPDMAVGLELDDGTKSVFIIEADSGLRPTPQHIAPDHRVAALLAGKSKDDGIVMPDSSQGKIAWIKPKQLHALHDLLENFGNRFPEMRGLQRVKVDFGKDGGLEPMLSKVRDRHDAIEEVNKLYEAGTLPLALAGRALGCDPIEALVGIAGSGIRIRSCDGTHLERATAFAAINNNAARGCVVDLATLHIIRRLGLEKIVAAVCGPIGIVARTALHYQRRTHELRERLNEADMSISFRHGQYYRTEITPEEKTQALEVAEADRAWIEQNATILPAEGKTDLSPNWRPLIAQFGAGFLDDLRAAQGSGRLLVCEDQLLRQLAQLDFQVPGTWLQPVLMRALSLKIITQDEYLAAIVQLIDSGLEFISISQDLLASSLNGVNDLAVPAAFKKLASRLGGKKADLASHTQVALGASIEIWRNEKLPWVLKQAALGYLLEQLIAERSSDDVSAIMSTFVQGDPWRGSKPSISNYVIDWLEGHFLLPALVPQERRARKR